MDNYMSACSCIMVNDQSLRQGKGGCMYSKQDRVLSIFFRALRGEDLFVRKLAGDFGVSAKSISRDLNDVKAFLADHRELVGNTELVYSFRDKCYRLSMDGFLSSKELLAVAEVLVGSRPFPKVELLTVMDKLRHFVSPEDRYLLEQLLQNELCHYSEIKHDCDSVQDNLWTIAKCIREKKEITINYFRMDRSPVTHRIYPASILFADFYYYLIAFPVGDNIEEPRYFRLDRIRHITVHRHNSSAKTPAFDEGELRRKSLYMWPGKLQTIRFAFSGPSVQAVLDKLPTARIIERKDGTYIIEAEVSGDGIRMWLLSQGSWAKVLSPPEFVQQMRDEVQKLLAVYDESKSQ